MNMQEVRSQGYKVFGSVEDTRKRSALENAIKYVDLLAAQAQVDVSGWPVLEIMHNPTTGHIHTDKAKINQAFFNWTRTQHTSTSRLTAQRRQALNQMHESFKQIRRDRLLNEQNIFIRDAAHYAKLWDDNLHKAVKVQAQLGALNANMANEFAQSLEEILSDGWYKIDEITPDSIRLITPDIVLSQINQAQKVNLQIPFGSFLVEYNLRSAGLRVLRHKNNFPPEEQAPLFGYRFHATYYHPHVSHEGRVCFGDITSAVQKAIATFDLKTVFTATRQVLTTFHSENPYVQLYSFDNYLKHIAKEKEKNNGKEKEVEVRQPARDRDELADF